MRIKFNLKRVFWAAFLLMLLAAVGPMSRLVYALETEPETGEVVLLAKTTPVITATSQTAEYDGQPHYITATITDNLPLVVTYYDADDNVVAEPTIPGIYLVDIRFDGNENYNPASKSVSLTITKGEFDTAVFQGLTVTYDGNVHSLVVTGIPADATVTYTNNGQINAGSYEVTAVISKPYYNDLVMTNMLVINKVIPVIAANNLDVTYDGVAHYITASISHGLILTKEYRNEAGEVVASPTNAGKYTLTLNYMGDANYTSVNKTVFLTIRPAQIVGVVLPDLTVTYDGNVHNLAATGIPAGATVSYNSTGYVNAGIYVIGVTVSKPNYSDYYTTGTLTIKRASLNGIVTFSNQSFVYDGAPHALAVAGLPASGVTVRYTRNTLTNVGNITAMAVVEGSNYETLTLYADLTITKAASVISVLHPVFEFDYDGTLKEVSATLNHSETELTYAPVKGYVNVGTYEITITATETANYSGTSVTVTLVIRPIAITGVTFEDMTAVYDGTEHVLLASGLPEGCVVTYTNNAHVTAGVYEARVRITKENYLNLELVAYLTIGKAQSVIIVDEQSLDNVYDGTMKSVRAALNHGETGLSFSPAAGYVSAGTYVITVFCADSANYLGASVEVSLVIHKAETVISAALEQTFIYDGTAKKAVAYSNHAEASLAIPEHANAGTYSDTITIAETANYQGASLTITIIIEKATAFIQALPVQVHTYNGTFKGVVAGLSHNETTLTYDPVTGYINAGEYTITLSAVETANYKACTATVLLVITKARGIIDTADVQEHTYDGTFKEVIAHLNHDEVELTYSPVTGYIEPGIYTVNVHAAESGNYLEDNRTVTLIIDKIESVITADVVQTHVYDKTMKEVVASLNHGETELLYAPFKGFIDAGQYAITVVALETAHYQTAVLEVTLVINKAVASITADAVQNFTYDGTIKEVTGTLSHEETGLLYSPQKGYVNAGDYQITISALESANYLSCEIGVILRIGKADLSGIVFNSQDLFYDGFEHEILVTNLPEGAQVQYTDNRSTDVCNLTAEALITKENYNDLVLTANLLIRQVTSVISAAPVQTFEYNEDAHEVLASLNFAGTALSFTPANAFTMIGEYDVTISVDETPNNTAATLVVHVVIVKGTPVITAVSEEVTYDGLVHHIDASINHNLPLSVVYISSDANELTDPVNADHYIVELSFAGNEFFNPVDKLITLTINKASLTGIALPAQTFVYDGAEHGLMVNDADIDGLSIALENNVQSQAGTYEVQATVFKPNYETLILKSILSITRKQLSITSVSVPEREYNGSPHVTLTGGVLEGIVNDEEVTFDLGNGLMDNPDVGNQKPVQTSIRLTGADAANYELVQPNLKVNITKRILKVNAPDLWKIADGTRKIDVAHVCLSGIVGNDDVYLNGNPQGQLVNAEPGNDIDVLLSGITLAGEEADNYGLDLTGITGCVLLGSLSLTAGGTTLVISRCEGFDSQHLVRLAKVEDQETLNQVKQAVAVIANNTSIRVVYQVEADSLDLRRPAKMELMIPEEYRNLSSLSLYHVTETGCEKVEACRKGDRLSFETSEFGYFVITSVPTISFFMMAAIIFSIIVLTIAIIYLITRYHQRLVKTN